MKGATVSDDALAERFEAERPKLRAVAHRMLGSLSEADDALAERFEAERPKLRAVAHRMLGSLSEADDAVQEAWLRLNRTDAAELDNLGAWLTTVVGRICLDMLRSRTTRREEPLELRTEEPPADAAGPEQEALLA